MSVNVINCMHIMAALWPHVPKQDRTACHNTCMEKSKAEANSC